MGRDAVADSSLLERMAGKLSLIRGGVGVLIIRNHQNERQLLYRRLVQCFMERPGGRSAFPNARRSNGTAIPPETMSHQGAVDHGDHRSEMADHREQTLARPTTMNVPVAPAHG